MKFLLNIIIQAWNVIIYIPILNILYIILAFNSNLGFAIILLSIIARILLLPTSYHQLWVSKMSGKLNKKLNKIKKKQVRQKMQKELYKKHKFNPLSGIGVMILSIPIMIALYKVVSVAQQGVNALTPFVYPFVVDFLKHYVGLPTNISTQIFGIQLHNNPNSLMLILLALSAGVQTVLSIMYNNSQDYNDVLKTVKKQFKMPDAKEKDYKLMANTIYYGKYINAITGALIMVWIFKSLPAVFTLYILTLNIFNILTLPILHKIVEKRLPEVK